MDMNFLGNINSIYALIGVVITLIFQVWIKSREDKKYRLEREEKEQKERELKESAKKEQLELDKEMHRETLEATNKAIDMQVKQTEVIIESLNRNNEITDLNTEAIIDIAETLDKKHKTKKSYEYKKRFKEAENKHKRKLK